MTPEEFRKALASHKHTLPQLRLKLESIPAGQRAETLLDLFANQTWSNTAYQDQETAGRLLVAMVPKLRQPLDDILRAIAPSWNVSVEQLPYYLREVFGKDAVVQAAQRLTGEFAPESHEARALLTVIWCLSGKGD